MIFCLSVCLSFPIWNLSYAALSWLERSGTAGWKKKVSHPFGKNLMKEIVYFFFCLFICFIFALVFFIVLSLFYSTCSEENHCCKKIDASGEI